MGCLTEDEILRFVEGGLTDRQLVVIEAHARMCETCEQLLAGGAAMATERGARVAQTVIATAGTLSRGTLVARYTVLALIGHGGMGEVYAAYDPQLDRKVALKLLRQRADGEARSSEARLLGEARAIAQLTHPNVVTVYDVGTFDNRVFVAMEYVDGQTLARWLTASARTRGEILSIFTQAAQGLAAAHAAGLVHRDFKPQNVLVGHDGTVRVTDFGLARRFEVPGPPAAVAPEEMGRDKAVDVRLTETGDLVGTPLYMAPEQFLRRPVDARTDQFSFSVALYEALYDDHPFLADGGVAQLMIQVPKGRVRPAPERGTVPAWLRRVLLRGLAVAPDARWPSMAALTAALARDPARIRRRAAFAAMAAIFVVTVVGLGRWPRPTQTFCKAGPSHLAGVWRGGSDAPEEGRRRAVMAAAFLATGLPNAQETWQRVAALLDGYASDWLAMYQDTCEATQVRGEQSQEILDLRMGCLDGRRSSLKALSDVMVTADRAAVENAIGAVNALPELDRCSNVKLLRMEGEPPFRAKTREHVDDLRRRAATARVYSDAGRSKQAIALIEQVIIEVRQLAYDPLLAEVLELKCSFQVSGGFQAASASTLEEAFWVGLRSKRDDIAAEAAALLTSVVGYELNRKADGERWAKLSETLLDRLGEGHERTRAWLLHARANMHEEDDLKSALRFVEQSIAIKRRILPTNHPDIALGLILEAEILHRMDEDSAALEVAGQAETIFMIAYGPGSPSLAWLWSNRAEYLMATNPAEAASLFRRALGRREAFDQQSVDLAYPLTGLGRALLALGRGAEARPYLERALKIREANERRPVELAETDFALAESLSVTGARRRAAALAARALGEYRQAPGMKKKANEVATWIGENNGRGRHGSVRPPLPN